LQGPTPLLTNVMILHSRMRPHATTAPYHITSGCRRVGQSGGGLAEPPHRRALQRSGAAHRDPRSRSGAAAKFAARRAPAFPNAGIDPDDAVAKDPASSPAHLSGVGTRYAVRPRPLWRPQDGQHSRSAQKRRVRSRLSSHAICLQSAKQRSKNSIKAANCVAVQSGHRRKM